VDRLLSEAGFPRLDLLSVDVEGTELDVLKGANIGRWAPRCIIAEHLGDPSPISDYLAPFGYVFSEKIDRDYCYRRNRAGIE
jgi:hypothetical protein